MAPMPDHAEGTDHADRVREETARALESIEAAVRWKLTLGPIVLEDEYLRSIDRVEALPRNRPGNDKAWLGPMVAARKRFFEAIDRSSPDDPRPWTPSTPS